MATSAPVPPATPSERYLADIMERVKAVKQKLAEEGVEEQDIPQYMPGVLAITLGMPLPHCGENGPKLPKGLMAKEVFNQKSLQHIKECKDANENVADIINKNGLMSVKKSEIMDNCRFSVIRQTLHNAFNTAGIIHSRKTKFYFDYTPCDAEAFYRKIEPLLGEYDCLAEQLRDVRRNLV